MKKCDMAELLIKIAKVFFILCAIAMFFFVVIGEIVSPNEQGERFDNCREIEVEWQQILEDGSRVPVEIPGKVEVERGEPASIVTTLPTNIEHGEYLFFRPVWQDVAVYINGQLREYYTTKDSRPFGTNSAFRYVCVELTNEDVGGELICQFTSDSKYSGVIQKIQIGEKMSFWMQIVFSSGLRTLLALALLVLSLFCILVCAVLKWGYKMTLPLYYLAWTIFLCALWTLSEVELRQLLISNLSILTNYTYWTLMLIPITMLIYIDIVQESRYRKIYLIPLLYSICLAVIGTVLQVFDIVQFVEQLPFVHGGILVTILCVICTILWDFFVKKKYDYLVVGIGIFGMLLTSIGEIISYYMGSRLYFGTILVLGLTFLLSMAIVKTGQDLLNAERKRQQAIMARDAQAKFLANMSHEIRTPINAVIGMNEMILRENDNAAVAEYAQNIQSASNMLLGLVNDILDFSKIESGQLDLIEDTYSLVPILQDEVLLLNTRLNGKPIEMRADIDPYIPAKLKGDELRLKQIITNLLSNAVKYTKEGSVTFKAFFKWIDADNIELCFSVIDTGVGIKQENLASLFDSFKRFELNANRTIEGTGLGLNIVKQLVDRMQGTISVESEYGKGSNFTVCIPQQIMDKTPIGNVEQALTEMRAPKTAEEKIITAEKASVLVVDDNAMNLSVIKNLLKRTRMKLDTADSGKVALDYAKGKKYDLIFMDHMMPEMDGVQVLNALRADAANPNQNTPVVVLTANAIAGCREMYLEFGFNDYISKPIQTKKLDEMLLRYLPEELVVMKSAENVEVVSAEPLVQDNLAENTEEDILVIDKKLGISYSLDSEEIYKEILGVFCEQSNNYLPQLQECYENKNWEKYGIIAHAIKGNSLNIGASEFSKLSLKHEKAAKEGDIEFITEEYEKYVTILKQLIEKVKEIR